MNNKKIAICMIYSFSCMIIVIISGLLAGIGMFVLFMRALIFASISFVAVFLGQLFLQNHFMDNDFSDDKSDNERGSTLDIVVGDAYDVSREHNSEHRGDEQGNEANAGQATQGGQQVAYNKERRVDNSFFKTSTHDGYSSAKTDDFVDLSRDIAESKKYASNNPEKFSNALKSWVHDAKAKEM